MKKLEDLKTGESTETESGEVTMPLSGPVLPQGHTPPSYDPAPPVFAKLKIGESIIAKVTNGNI